MVTIRYVSREELMRRLERELEEVRVTVEEFRAEGEADMLTDGHLRDLWLHYRPLLFESDLRDEPCGPRDSLGVENDRGSGSSESPRPGADGGHRESVSETPTVRYVTREELWEEMEARLEDERVTVEQFRVEGEADTLTDGYLRDLWLKYRPLLFDDDLRAEPGGSEHP